MTDGAPGQHADQSLNGLRREKHPIASARQDAIFSLEGGQLLAALGKGGSKGVLRIERTGVKAFDRFVLPIYIDGVDRMIEKKALGAKASECAF